MQLILNGQSNINILLLSFLMQTCSALRWHPQTPIQDHLSSLFLSLFSNSGNVTNNQTLVLLPVQTLLSFSVLPNGSNSFLCSSNLLILSSNGSNSNNIFRQVLKLRKEVAAESILLAKMREYSVNII